MEPKDNLNPKILADLRKQQRQNYWMWHICEQINAELARMRDQMATYMMM